MVDQVDADGVVDAGHEGDAQLGADAVGARHEHRIAAARAPSRNRPPNDPRSDRTPGVKVPRASRLMRRTTSLPASMSTPARL